jgi:hypothetical protein
MNDKKNTRKHPIWIANSFLFTIKYHVIIIQNNGISLHCRYRCKMEEKQNISPNVNSKIKIKSNYIIRIHYNMFSNLWNRTKKHFHAYFYSLYCNYRKHLSFIHTTVMLKLLITQTISDLIPFHSVTKCSIWVPSSYSSKLCYQNLKFHHLHDKN